MTGKIIPILIFLFSCSCPAIAADLESKDSDFANNVSVELSILFSSSVSSIAIPSAYINMQSAIKDMQIKGFFFQELKRKILYAADDLESELGLTAAQQTGIRSILEQIDIEDKTRLSERIRSMCAVWYDLDQTPDHQERAEKALDLYQQQENQDLTSNISRRNFFRELTALVGEEKAAVIRQLMNNFSANNFITPITWPDIIRSIGLEVDQLDFTCSQSTEQ